MTYITQLENIPYKFGNEASSNIFQNLTIYSDMIDDIKDATSIYNYYYAPDDDRPDQLSTKLYGTPDHYWTFFLMNDHIRERGWPLSSQQLENKVKKDYPNTVLTTRDNLKGRFKVGEYVAQLDIGITTGGKIIRRNLDLGQLIIEGDYHSIETPYTTNHQIQSKSLNPLTLIYSDTGDSPINITAVTAEYNSTHKYTDENSLEIDLGVDSSSGGLTAPGGLWTATSKWDLYITANEELKKIRIIKPERIEEVVASFKKAMRI